MDWYSLGSIFIFVVIMGASYQWDRYKKTLLRNEYLECLLSELQKKIQDLNKQIEHNDLKIEQLEEHVDDLKSSLKESTEYFGSRSNDLTMLEHHLSMLAIEAQAKGDKATLELLRVLAEKIYPDDNEEENA